MALLQKAQADGERFSELSPTFNAYWTEADATGLVQLIAKQKILDAPTPDEANWFDPGNTTNAKVIAAIAARLDAAFFADAGKSPFTAYRKTLQDLVALAGRSGNVVAARHAIAVAAKAQGNGAMRGAETKAMEPTPTSLWSYVEPAMAR
jgi:hypothetical protein